MESDFGDVGLMKLVGLPQKSIPRGLAKFAKLTVRNLLRSACFLLERPLSHEFVGLLIVPLS